MIAYEELVAALNYWRTNQGLPTGATDFLGEPPPPPSHVVPQPEVEYVAADDMAIEEESYDADHIHTGDSTDTVDVSEIEVLSEEVYDEQPLYDDQPLQDDVQPVQDDLMVADAGEEATAFGEPPALEDAAYDAPAGDDAPLYADAEELSQAPAGADSLEPPPVVDVDERMETQAEGQDEEEKTMVAGDLGGDASGDLTAGADEHEDDDATRVAGEFSDAPPIVDVAGADQPDDGRQTLDTEASPVVSESDLPDIPPVGGEIETSAPTRDDSTMDIDLGADLIEEAPVVSGELGGDPKPE